MKTTLNGFLSLCAIIISILAVSETRSQAQVTQTLYSTPTGTTRDNYNGDVGSQFQVGATNVVVSHLGFFGTSGGLAVDHIAGILDTHFKVLGQVTVPAGTGAYFTNGFWWVPLDPPLLLTANGTYNLAASVGNGDGDAWPDAFSATWNSYFIGSTATTTRHAMYGPGAVGWPPPSLTPNGNNTAYGNVCLAYIEVGPARVGVQTTNVSISAGQTLSVPGFASGQANISYQWYLAPNTLLSKQTNATLTILNAGTGDSGTYFLTASNTLGGEQSAPVTVSVTSIPVDILQQPTNAIAAFQNYPVNISITATGSPPIYYQWMRNGIAIPGATSTNYSFTAQMTNDNDIYSCVVSNYTSLTPYTTASSNTVLTVIPNLALPQQFLHGYNTNLSQNNFSGMIGGQITVGSSAAIVTHLGYYAPTNQYTDSTHCNLTQSHRVGIFNAGGTVLLGYVTVPSGVSPVVNGYIWAPLNPPLVLATNTQYLLATEVFAGIDPWGQSYAVSDLNPDFASACDATYWGAAWPGGGVSGKYTGQMYSAPNLAILALPTPAGYVQPTNVTQWAGFDTNLTAIVDGQPPLTLQWYKEPNMLMTGETNLNYYLNNLSVEDSGSYYVIVTNSMTGSNVQSSDAVLTVLADVGPSIMTNIQSQDVYVHSTVSFYPTISGTPPFSYQWTFNGNPISGATNINLTLNDVTTANVGNYQLLVTNNYGYASTLAAGLTIEIPAWGSYPSAVMNSNLLAYYRFSDANSGLGIATNQGALGFSCNGTYEANTGIGGSYSGAAGPTSPNFEPDNLAVLLDGFSSDVLVPSFGNITVTNCTIAAWVNDAGGQPDNSTIFYHRQSNVFGLSIGQNGSGEWLKYTWNNGSYNNNTGLILPTNQWAFVAMVINPTSATIYLQNGTGMYSTNFTGTYSPQTFTGNSYIGWDSQGGATGRRWTGAIDEVMIFNQALSPVAVNALYLGVPAAATVKISPSGGGNLMVTWPGGTLLEATNIAGPWTPTSGANNGSYALTPSSAMKFYKVQLQ